MFPINSVQLLRLCSPLRNERVGIPLAICRESGLNLGANASFSRHPPFVVVQDDDDDGDDDDQHKDNSLKRRLAGKASGGKAPLREWETVPPGPEPEFSWRSAVKLFGSRQTAPSQKKQAADSDLLQRGKPQDICMIRVVMASSISIAD